MTLAQFRQNYRTFSAPKRALALREAAKVNAQAEGFRVTISPRPDGFGLILHHQRMDVSLFLDGPGSGPHAARARQFHAENPNVYDMALGIARRIQGFGVEHYGIGAIWEVLRYKYLETYGDVYKLNNNYRAWYARFLMENEADLEGFFQLRSSPHDPEYSG